MNLPTRTARPLDHLVLPVAELGRARRRLADLGFTVAEDARHPFGTENACVFLSDNTYLEPLAVASREECEAAALAGNAFIARDHAFRFRQGPEGLSAIVLGTPDAAADHIRYRSCGISGGEMLEFSRPMRLPDGREGLGSFRLAFAADLRAPDFFLFSCQRIRALPVDSALHNHENGVVGIAEVVLSEPNPTDFQYLLQEAVDEREVSAHSFGMDIQAGSAKLSVMNPAGMEAFYGRSVSATERGLRGRAVVFRVTDLEATRALFAQNDIEFAEMGGRLIVPEAPGQGVIFAFGV
ncbi:VOC family protein [Sinorhizobium fredii]|uniref:VOC family protein n=2 Tax=Rhizobium fredii TaxID=380 RepID=A0A2A6LV60_RHIFR|nr:VOC family protein [Sinorhizobium fredii]ASY68610.1 Lactoylglutathione lyase-related lyase [Sinorhizobium fredii CCBAU 83666]AWM24682.1 Lactoylglutathione lyase and related lyase [Sinorhizobium fredii CCBAU 25509]MCG5476043.1 VOC family protein [Sinorhizobium fredii]MQW98273.1 VOC family protein [Sinorhizobium fredii]PDT46170.1 VOC family protein [Sinorhizobium fredii]